jgi:topoisomerase-4 subunit A
VRGLQLREEDEVVAAEWVRGEEGEILVVSDLGYAKRSFVFDYPLQGRGGKGVITFEFKEGKRVRPNGSSLIAGFAVKTPFALMAVNSNDDRHVFTTEETAIEDRKSVGMSLIPVVKGTHVTSVIRLPALQS